jgi:hypothetical protein
VNSLIKQILILKGENKLEALLETIKQQKQTMITPIDSFSKVKFTFSDGTDPLNIPDYSLIALLSNPNDEIWDIIQRAEKLRIPVMNSPRLIAQYNDCLQTQLNLEQWGFNIPKLGKLGLKKKRYHENRKNGIKSFRSDARSLNSNSSFKNYYHEQFIQGKLFKIKVLGKRKFFVVHVEQNGKNSPQREDQTQKNQLLGNLALKIARKVQADFLSIDFIVEKNTNIPYCIDVNLGNAFTGVENGTIQLLDYLAKKTIVQPGLVPKNKSKAFIT